MLVGNKRFGLRGLSLSVSAQHYPFSLPDWGRIRIMYLLSLALVLSVCVSFF